MDSEHGKHKNFQMWYCAINGRKQNKSCSRCGIYFINGLRIEKYKMRKRSINVKYLCFKK